MSGITKLQAGPSLPPPLQGLLGGMQEMISQRFVKIEGKSVNDCHLLAALAYNIEHGIIFDTVLDMLNGDDEREIDRILSYNPDGASKFIYYCDTMDSDIKSIRIQFTQTQYEGLAAIQDAINVLASIPTFVQGDNGELIESDSYCYIADENGKCYVATEASGKIATIEHSDIEAPDGEMWARFSWEDAQKLIGLPIS